MFGVPGIGQNAYDPNKGFCENNKLPLTFLSIGGILTTLGITLICLSSGQAMSTIGSVVTTIGVPMVSYGIFGLIYNRCVHGGPICPKSNKKVKPAENRQPISIDGESNSSQVAKREEVRKKREQFLTTKDAETKQKQAELAAKRKQTEEQKNNK